MMAVGLLLLLSDCAAASGLILADINGLEPLTDQQGTAQCTLHTAPTSTAQAQHMSRGKAEHISSALALLAAEPEQNTAKLPRCAFCVFSFTADLYHTCCIEVHHSCP
jgi:hypothetical protein